MSVKKITWRRKYRNHKAKLSVLMPGHCIVSQQLQVMLVYHMVKKGQRDEMVPFFWALLTQQED